MGSLGGEDLLGEIVRFLLTLAWVGKARVLWLKGSDGLAWLAVWQVLRLRSSQVRELLRSG